MKRRHAVLFLAAALAVAAPAAAQTDTMAVEATPPVRLQAISILPLHAIIGFYAGDYERAISPTSTVGVGGSYFDIDDFTYASAEAKFRYYPSGDPLRGLSFGVTAGPTFLGEEGVEDEEVTAIGVGFEVARSHILGQDRRFYYGYGAGLKRLFFTGEELDGVEAVIPTLRLAVGYAF